MPPRRHLVHVPSPPGGVTAAATAFMAKHTTPVRDLEGECAVCYEDHGSRVDVRTLKINDVAGCKHAFCEACISKILSRPSNVDKKCPLCNAVWMAGTAGQAEGGSASAGVSHHYLSHQLKPITNLIVHQG